YHFHLPQSHHHQYLQSFPTRRSSDLMRAKSSLLHRFLWECPSEQRSITCHNYVLPTIKFIRDWGISHMPNGGMPEGCTVAGSQGDRKSTRLNSSHVSISYAVFCLKKK